MRGRIPSTTLIFLVALAGRVPLPATMYAQAGAEAAASSSIDPTTAGSPLYRARYLATQGQFAAAERELRDYLVLHPGNAPALYEMGNLLYRENRPKESLAAYTEAAKGEPPSAEDLRIVALNYVLLDDFPDAVRWLDRAVAVDPRSAETWYDLGRSLMMQKDLPAAEIALKRSLTLIPEPAGSAVAVKAENNLGVTYEDEARGAEAEVAYLAAIGWQRGSQRPSEQPLLNYGKLLIATNRSAEAVAPLEEAARIAPGDPKCHEQLARALDKSAPRLGPGDAADRAQAEMLRAIQLDPSNARLHFELGLMYRRVGKLQLSHEQMALSGDLYGSHSTASDH